MRKTCRMHCIFLEMKNNTIQVLTNQRNCENRCGTCDTEELNVRSVSSEFPFILQFFRWKHSIFPLICCVKAHFQGMKLNFITFFARDLIKISNVFPIISRSFNRFGSDEIVERIKVSESRITCNAQNRKTILHINPNRFVRIKNPHNMRWIVSIWKRVKQNQSEN